MTKYSQKTFFGDKNNVGVNRLPHVKFSQFDWVTAGWSLVKGLER